MQTLYDPIAGRSQNARRHKFSTLRGNGPARSAPPGPRVRTPNEIADLLLEDPLPTRLERRRRATGRQSADVDTGVPYDRPFGRAGPRR
jgi:hypothetical protein